MCGCVFIQYSPIIKLESRTVFRFFFPYIREILFSRNILKSKYIHVHICYHCQMCNTCGAKDMVTKVNMPTDTLKTKSFSIYQLSNKCRKFVIFIFNACFQHVGKV